MENEDTKKTGEQEAKEGKESGFEWCRDCCEGMSFDDKMKKNMMKDMMSFCKGMDIPEEGKTGSKEPFRMFKKFAGCCGPSDSKKV